VLLNCTKEMLLRGPLSEECKEEVLSIYENYMRASLTAESTIQNRLHVVRRALREGVVPLNALSVSRYISKYKPFTRAIYAVIFNQVATAIVAECEELATDPQVIKQLNIMKKMKRRKSEPVPRKLTSEEVQRLLQTAQSLDPLTHAIIYFLLETGLRVSELASLKPENFTKLPDGSYRLILMGKGSKERELRVSPEPVELLFRSGFFGEKLSRYQIYYRVRKAGRLALGKPVYPHLLRHTFAHGLADAMVSMPKIQAVLGHSSLSVTDRYVRSDSTSIQLGRLWKGATGGRGSKVKRA